MTKRCLICKKKFYKRYNYSKKYFATQKYCSYKCMGMAMRDIVKKQWKNKIRKGGWKLSEEIKMKMSERCKGKGNPMYGKSYSWAGFQKGHMDFVPKEGRRRQALKLTGNKCHLWRGGITSINLLIRCQKKYKKWRMKVFQRDNFVCKKCGAKNGNGKAICLEAHHIKPFSKYPKLRFKISNGITLCKECHRKIKK